MNSINVADQQYLIREVHAFRNGNNHHSRREPPRVTRSFRYYRFYQIDSFSRIAFHTGQALIPLIITIMFMGLYPLIQCSRA